MKTQNRKKPESVSRPPAKLRAKRLRKKRRIYKAKNYPL